MRIALAGDTMLGRGVAERLTEGVPLFAPEVVEVVRDADVFVLNLECCISERGDPWPAPGKPFFFRAPPSAVDALGEIGADCVTLANNHALDFGDVALDDTLRLLDDGGISVVGAGPDLEAARRPVVLEAAGERLAILGFTDHPEDFAAAHDRPGVAFVDLRRGGIPPWVRGSVENAPADVSLVTPHWGPNMTTEPVPSVREAAEELVDAGATLVAGHSAHAFHGVLLPVLFDLGDFLDDYAVDPIVRNDLGLVFVVDLDSGGVRSVEAIPIALDYCFTRLAAGDERRWIERRFRAACAAFGTDVRTERDRFVVSR